MQLVLSIKLECNIINNHHQYPIPIKCIHASGEDQIVDPYLTQAAFNVESKKKMKDFADLEVYSKIEVVIRTDLKH